MLIGVAVMENGAAVLDQIGQKFLHWRVSERRHLVEFGGELAGAVASVIGPQAQGTVELPGRTYRR